MDDETLTRLPRGLRPLTFQAYRRVWIGAFVSNIGTWVATVAVGIYVTVLTQQAAWTGLVAAAAMLPGFVLAPLGGALADRFPRKVLLILSTLTEAACAALLAALVGTGHAPPLAVTLIVLVNGAASVISWPAFSSILPELVPPDDIPSAVALSSTQWNLGRIIGPALAGLVIAVAGYTWAFALNAVSFFAVILAVLPVAVPALEPPEQRFLRSLRAGVGFFRRDRGVRNGVTLWAINSFIAAPFMAMIPAVALKVFDNESPGTAILITAQGIGAVIMALSMGSLTHRFGLRRLLMIACAFLPGVLIAYALSPTLWVATFMMLLVGATYLVTFSGVFTIAQSRAPNIVRGRVVSLFMATVSLAYPLGSLLQGWLGDRIGLPQTTIASAIVLVVIYGIFTATTRGFLPGLDDPLAPGAPGADAAPEPPIEFVPD